MFLTVKYAKEVAISIATPNLSLPFYEQVLDFLSKSPSAQELIDFRPTPAAQAHFSELLELNRDRVLSPQEGEELDHYVQIERMISLLKAKALRHIN